MQKEFAQLMFRPSSSEELAEFKLKLKKAVFSEATTMDAGTNYIRLRSSDLANLFEIYQDFKDNEQVALTPLRYIKPTVKMAHAGGAVEPYFYYIGYDLWVQIEPIEGFENEIGHVLKEGYDAEEINALLNEFFLQSPDVQYPVISTKAGMLLFWEYGEPKKSSLYRAMNDSFNAAFSKAQSVLVEATLSASLLVPELQFEKAKKFVAELGIEEILTDELSELKKISFDIPCATLIENYAKFIELAKKGEFGFDVKTFSVVKK